VVVVAYIRLHYGKMFLRKQISEAEMSFLARQDHVFFLVLKIDFGMMGDRLVYICVAAYQIMKRFACTGCFHISACNVAGRCLLP
jgi:hypothetical protein